MTALNGSGRTVLLTDGPHVIKFTSNVLIEIEDRFGSLENIDEKLQAKPLRNLRFLLWAGLGCQGTEESVGALMDGVPFQPIGRVVAEALEDAIGADPSEATDPTKPAAVPTPGPTS